MNGADTQGITENQDPNGVPAAGAQELSIPKWRFDEVNARLRAREEEISIKDSLLKQAVAQQQQQAQPQQPQGFSPEELGIDHQTFLAAQKIAGAIVDQRVGQEAGKLKGMIAQMANDLEEAKFLQRFPGKDAYLQKIREHRARHYQMTGGYIDLESAYKIVRFEETERQGARAPQAQAPQAQPQAPAYQQPEAGYPNPAMTRTAPAGAVAPAKSYDEMSVEELEARLDEGFRSGHMA